MSAVHLVDVEKPDLELTRADVDKSFAFKEISDGVLDKLFVAVGVVGILVISQRQRRADAFVVFLGVVELCQLVSTFAVRPYMDV